MDDNTVVACPRGDTLYIWRAGDTVELVAREFAVAESAVTPAKEGVTIDNIQPGDAVCIRTRVSAPDTETPTPDTPSRPPSGGTTPRPPSSGDCQFIVNGQCVNPRPECPDGYRSGTVRLGDTYTTILRRYNISYDAFRDANPTINPARLSPGQRFCAPPSGTRTLCSDGGSSYIISVSGGLDAVAAALDTTPGRLLISNPSLAPADFIPGRVICTG